MDLDLSVDLYTLTSTSWFIRKHVLWAVVFKRKIYQIHWNLNKATVIANLDETLVYEWQ